MFMAQTGDGVKQSTDALGQLGFNDMIAWTHA